MTTHPTERLSAYLDHELPEVERQEVDAHLRACAACGRHLEELAGVDAAALGLEVVAPEGYFEALPERLRGRLAAVPARRSTARPWMMALAAGLVLAVVVPLTLRDRPVPDAPAAAEAQRARRESKAAPAPVATAPAPPLPQAPPAADARSRDEAEARKPVPAAPALARTPAEPAPPAGNTFAVPPPAAAGVAPGTINEATPAPAPAAEAADLAWRADQESAERPLRRQARGAKEEAPAEATAQAAPQAAGRSAGQGARRADMPDPGFAALAARPTPTAADARAAREAWRRWAEDNAASSQADEARVRAVEAAVHAFRFSGDAADRRTAEMDAAAYLRRPDAAQAERVRRALGALASER